jgi:hypothetical protein
VITLLPWRLMVAATALAAFSTTAVLTAARLNPGEVTHDVAPFAHLVALVVGFGAVLSVDWVALLWMVGRRELGDVLRTADNVAVPIWAGYLGLVLSGACLAPELENPLTLAKLGLVLLIGWNGLVASWLSPALHAGSDRALTLSGMSAVISQLGWWGATVIGYLNAR